MWDKSQKQKEQYRSYQRAAIIKELVKSYENILQEYSTPKLIQMVKDDREDNDPYGG